MTFDVGHALDVGQTIGTRSRRSPYRSFVLRSEQNETCDVCYQPMLEGQRVRYGPDERAMHHVYHADKEPALAPLCVSCFLHHVGECM